VSSSGSILASPEGVAKKTSGTASRQAIRAPGLPAKQRAAVAARMKKYWRERRKRER
jgi:hypothetical protein